MLSPRLLEAKLFHRFHQVKNEVERQTPCGYCLFHVFHWFHLILVATRFLVNDFLTQD